MDRPGFIALFELFSGTGTLTRLAGARFGGHPLVKSTLAVDVSARAAPDLIADLHTDAGLARVELRMKACVEQGLAVVVHMSPPCQQYSRCNTIGVRNLEVANARVQRVLRLVKKYAVAWTVENPGTDHPASLWRQGLPELSCWKTVDYCAFGYPLKKSTGIAFSSQRMHRGFGDFLCRGDACPLSIRVPHRKRKRHIGHFGDMNREERSAMPVGFCARILETLVSEAQRHRETRLGEYAIDAVVGERFVRGQRMLAIKWTHWDEPEDITWERACDVCEEL